MRITLGTTLAISSLAAGILTMLATACAEPTPASLDRPDIAERGDEQTSADDDASASTREPVLEPEPAVDAGPDGRARAPRSTKKSCRASATKEACYQCCADQHPDGAAKFSELSRGCFCRAPGKCATACGTNLCAGKPPATACTDCLQREDEPCTTQAVAACTADADCAALTQCALRCEDK